MARIKYRKYGRDGSSSFSTGSSHILKIGWTETRQKKNSTETFKMPTRLRGFLICEGSVDREGKWMIAYDLMQRLGFSKNQVDEGVSKHYNAPDGCLPRELTVVVRYDATRDEDGEWDYPGTLPEEFGCWNKRGLFCSGNGCKAMRKQDDGTKKEIVCNPVGKEGVPASEFCTYSVKKECKPHGRLTVMVVVPDPNASKDRPRWMQFKSLADNFNATYRLDTSGDYGLIDMTSELDRVADKLNGRIAGLIATLSVAMEPKRLEEGSTIVPILHLRFDEIQVRAREQELWNRYIEGKREVPLLPAPDATGEWTPPESETPPDDEPIAEEATAGATEEPKVVDVEHGQSESSNGSHDPSDPFDKPARQDGDAFDSPAKAKTETAPAHHIKVGEATLEELVDALDCLIKDRAANEKKPYAEISLEVCHFVFNREPWRYVTPKKFLESKNADAALEIVRGICDPLERGNHPAFVVLRAEAVAV